MVRKTLLSISSFLITSISIACTCAYTEEFNLVDYDSYDYIFEVKVESKYEFKKDTVKSDIPKPPSLYENGLLNGYNISIIEVFKGDLERSEKVMGFPGGSSCSWIPKLGFTYIFYANSLNGVEACNRKLIEKYDKENYQNEKSILQFLKTKPSEVKIESNENILIEGKHVNGERDGVWKIYSITEKNKLKFKLTYKNGDLFAIEKGAGYYQEKKWDSISYAYFFEQRKKCGLDNNPTLNELEAEYFNKIFSERRGEFDFTDKKAAFFRGSTGTTKSDKSNYFDSVKSSNSEDVHEWQAGGTQLLILTEKEKELSGGYDVILVSWSKLLVKGKFRDRLVRKLKRNP